VVDPRVRGGNDEAARRAGYRAALDYIDSWRIGLRLCAWTIGCRRRQPVIGIPRAYRIAGWDRGRTE
jgi:hypothetical protein